MKPGCTSVAQSLLLLFFRLRAIAARTAIPFFPVCKCAADSVIPGSESSNGKNLLWKKSAADDSSKSRERERNANDNDYEDEDEAEGPLS